MINTGCDNCGCAVDVPFDLGMIQQLVNSVGFPTLLLNFAAYYERESERLESLDSALSKFYASRAIGIRTAVEMLGE